jgi:hypothetical protein
MAELTSGVNLEHGHVPPRCVAAQKLFALFDHARKPSGHRRSSGTRAQHESKLLAVEEGQQRAAKVVADEGPDDQAWVVFADRLFEHEIHL